MPIYKWSGVDLLGETVKGTTCADTSTQLEGLLLSRQIAPLRIKRISPFFMAGPTVRMRIRFFEQCSAMLHAGIPLPVVLQNIASAHEQELIMQIIVRGLYAQVQAGVPLYAACSKFPRYFDGVSLAMIKAGEQSGALSGAMSALAKRLQMHHEFMTKIRSALTVPAITGLFFVGACAIMLGVIVPSFSSLFTASYAILPTTTRMLLVVSSYTTFKNVSIVSFMSIVTMMAFRFWLKHEADSLGKYKDRLMLRIPYVGRIIRWRYMVYFFDSVVLLLNQSVLLMPALAIAVQTVHNHVLKEELRALQEDVGQGLSLHASLAMHVKDCDPSMVSMIATGEHIADLPRMVSFVCQDLQALVFERLAFITKVIQPALLVVLGLLVSLLIFSVYVPLIGISATF